MPEDWLLRWGGGSAALDPRDGVLLADKTMVCLVIFIVVLVDAIEALAVMLSFKPFRNASVMP